MMWWATKARNTFSLGITFVWGKGVKVENVRYGGRCKQHRDLCVSVCFGAWQFSRRYWLGEVRDNTEASGRRDKAAFAAPDGCEEVGGES